MDLEPELRPAESEMNDDNPPRYPLKCARATVLGKQLH